MSERLNFFCAIRTVVSFCGISKQQRYSFLTIFAYASATCYLFCKVVSYSNYDKMIKDKIEIVDLEKKIARRILPPPDEPRWFAMSAPYRRELKAQAALDEKGIENYVPMRYEIVVKGAMKKKMLVPVIHNLIFVYCKKETIQNAKQSIPYLQYRTNREGDKNVPIIVPDKQMKDFKKVCDSYDEQIRFFLPGELNVTKVTRVRITEGKFAGVEGTFVRLAGKRGRSVVVEIPFITNVATAIIAPEDVEVIGD